MEFVPQIFVEESQRSLPRVNPIGLLAAFQADTILFGEKTVQRRGSRPLPAFATTH
jgi:hypothetical protein